MTVWCDDLGRAAVVNDLDAGVPETPCHVFPEANAPTAHCGVPRSEQAPHGPRRWISAQQTHCAFCGRPLCPRCMQEFRDA